MFSGSRFWDFIDANAARLVEECCHPPWSGVRENDIKYFVTAVTGTEDSARVFIGTQPHTSRLNRNEAS